MTDVHGTARLLITSIDGNVTHPFRWDQTVDDVKQFGYDRLVKDKSQTPISNTWMEFSGNRVDGSTKLSSLGDPNNTTVL